MSDSAANEDIDPYAGKIERSTTSENGVSVLVPSRVRVRNSESKDGHLINPDGSIRLWTRLYRVVED